MGFNLTTRAFLLSRQTRIEPQIILDIDGIDLIFGAVDVTVGIKYGTSGVKYGDEGIFYGGVVVDPNSREYISIGSGPGSSKTTKNISQQLLQDKGGTSSVSRFTIELVNKNNELSNIFTPGVNIPDIIAANAKVFITFQGSSYPEDAVKIFDGIISDCEYGPGKIILTVAHPEELKRQEVFRQVQTELSANIDNVQTNIPVLTTNGILESQDAITTYVRIDDEFMEVTGINPTSLDVVRGSLGTASDTHDDEAEVSTVYIFRERPLTGALKLMLSGGEEFYATLPIENINSPEGSFVQNAVTFDTLDLNSDIGVVAGDILEIFDSSIPSNNTTRNILSIVQSGAFAYCVVDGAPLGSEGKIASARFKSKYNTLKDGGGLLSRHVDIEQFERLDSIFSTSFPDYQFYLRDSVKLKEFIETELFFPSALYSIPRKGRSSVGYTVPPLSVETVPQITSTQITNIGSLVVNRSTTRFFYNAIVHKYNESLLDGEFIASEIVFSADSQNRIKYNNKPLNIESTGLRRNAQTINIINRIQSRLIERYKFAAQSVSRIKVLYKDGFFIEPGDVVAFGNEDTQILDPETGENMSQKLFEVINKSLSIIGGEVTLDLLDTNFLISARFGVISPSSIISSGATTTQIPLSKSFGTKDFELEVSKWVQYVGQELIIHNADYSFSETVTLLEISPTLPDTLIVSALSIAPGAGLIVDLAEYDESSQDANRFSKASHAYINYFGSITTGVSNTVFDVADASFLRVGQTVQVHNDDFSNNSDETTITDITGLTVTVADDLGFLPGLGDSVELIGFMDGGDPYRII